MHCKLSFRAFQKAELFIAIIFVVLNVFKKILTVLKITFFSNLLWYVSQTSEVLSNLFIYCLPCRKLEGCLAKHFRTVSSFPEWSWIRPHLKRTTAGVQRSKKFKSVGPRSHVTLASRKFGDCDGASAYLRFSTANAYFRWSSSRKNDKPPNEFESDGPVWYPSGKKSPRFQGHFHTFNPSSAFIYQP